MPHFILGTAGHIDHGKSSLVKALTGTDPDRLPEEKARGMTIELGFAHLDIPRPGGGGDDFSLGIVDVPGHADFVKNMVAGVGGIDIALIVVAADDSWMPQTEEHVQILSYLEVPQAVVALTKADLVDSDGAELAELDVREHLEGTPFAEAPIIPTSATTGAGLDALRSTLARLLADAPPPADIGKPRLSVDRVFTVKGIGTVVTGTLGGGSLAKGHAAIVQPLALESKVRSLQSHRHELDEASPGTRTAIGLQNVAIADKQEKQGVRRGDVVTIPGLGAAHPTAGVLVHKLDREIAGQPGSLRPLRHGMRVRLHHGGAAHSARLFLMEPGSKELPPGRSALAQIRFDAPAYCFAGDRFVLRDWGMQSTIAGGIVLDPDAERRHYRAPANRACLEAIAAAPHDPAAHLAAFLARDRMLRRSGVLKKSNFPATDVDAAIATLVDGDTAAESGDWLLDARWWRGIVAKACELVDAHHAKKPHLPGLPLTRIASFLAEHTRKPELLAALTDSLRAVGFRTSGKFIHRAEHEPKLPPDLARAAETIRRQLSGDPLAPPGIKELLAPGKAADQAFRFLVESGEIKRLDEKNAISAETWERLVETIRRHISQNGPATASELREATGTTRRILIPLLERLDTEKITVRDGDRRKLAAETSES
jgi:selenocysteine-specific elongation factor